MLRIILGVIAGFMTWSIIWVGSDQVLMTTWPDWYGLHQNEFRKAVLNNQPFDPDRTILLMHIFRSIVVSIMAGFIAAVVSGENKRSPLALGVLLLLFGAMVEAMAWSYLPLWYHLLFLALLIPMAVLGGKMKSNP